MLMNYKQNHSKQPAHIYNDYEGLEISKYNRISPNYNKNKWYSWGVVGHISWECPKPRAERDNSKAKEKCDNRKEVFRYEAKQKYGNT